MTQLDTSPGDVERLTGWLEHQHRLLEIMRYRLHGLQRMLASARDDLVVKAVDEVEEIRTQIGMADLHRDIAAHGLVTEGNSFNLSGLIASMDDEVAAERLSRLQDALQEEAAAIDELQERCVVACQSAIGDLELLR